MDQNIQLLVDMGFDYENVKMALAFTDHIEAAVEYLSQDSNNLIENNQNIKKVEEVNENQSATKLMPQTNEGKKDQLTSMMEQHLNNVTMEELKLTLIIRTDLKMTTGKIAAQCSHATLGAYRTANSCNSVRLFNWLSSGEKIVCLRCSSDSELELLKLSAEAVGLSTYFVRDAGKTQVAPSSRTVLAIGPDLSTKIDSITRHLKLY